MTAAAGLITCSMKVFISTWGRNGGSGVASSDRDGDAASPARTTATTMLATLRVDILVPTFRSLYTISATTFYELRKAMGSGVGTSSRRHY
jgi:hypothetical protein